MHFLFLNCVSALEHYKFSLVSDIGLRIKWNSICWECDVECTLCQYEYTLKNLLTNNWHIFLYVHLCSQYMVSRNIQHQRSLMSCIDEQQSRIPGKNKNATFDKCCTYMDVETTSCVVWKQILFLICHELWYWGSKQSDCFFVVVSFEQVL